MRAGTKLVLTFALGLLLLPWARTGYAADAADPAVRQIESFYATLLDTMKRGMQLGLEGRYRNLEPIVEKVFDLSTMSQLSVGPAWNSMSESDHASIVDAFKRMTVANYAKNFATFDGEMFSVDPMVRMRGEDKIVESKLTGGDGSTTPFNYRLRMSGDAWKIVDIYLNGYVSQIALRRADFSSTVASSGAAGLVGKINDLVDRQMATR